MYCVLNRLQMIWFGCKMIVMPHHLQTTVRYKTLDSSGSSREHVSLKKSHINKAVNEKFLLF